MYFKTILLWALAVYNGYEQRVHLVTVQSRTIVAELIFVTFLYIGIEFHNIEMSVPKELDLPRSLNIISRTQICSHKLHTYRMIYTVVDDNLNCQL